MARLQRGVNDSRTWCINNEFGKTLAQEWTGIVDTGEIVKPEDVSYGSIKRLKWKCSKGHEWFTTINNRTSNMHGCPYCNGKRISDIGSLKDWCLMNGEFGKQIISEWTGELKTGEHIDIDKIKYASVKKIKWRCKNNHEWFAGPNSRTIRRTGCPYCSGLYASEDNSLKNWCLSNGSFGQRLILEWTGENEEGANINISDVAYASNKRLKWRCSEGHEWVTAVKARTSRKTGCPYCSGKTAHSSGTLAEWCLRHGTYGNELQKQWVGQTETGKPIDMTQVSYGSSIRVKWRCSNNHEWVVAIHGRTHKETECPYCYNSRYTGTSNRRIEYSLGNWCDDNGEYGKQVREQWVGKLDTGKEIGINSIAYRSNMQVQWECSKGHKWIATINRRTRLRQGCPYCKGSRASETNNLKTWCLANGTFGQQLMSEWTGEVGDKKNICMDNVTKASSKRAKWRCAKGHEWFSTISNRTNKKSSCPYCSGKMTSNENSLKNWCLSNGSFGEKLISEWVGIDETGNSVEITEVTKASNKKVKWKCSKGHEWFTTINSRTKQKSGCPYCSGRLK